MEKKARYLLRFALFGAFFAFAGLVAGWQWYVLFEGKEMYVGTHPVTWSWVWNFLYASGIPVAMLALIIGSIKLLVVRGREKNAKVLRLEKTVEELKGRLEEFTKQPPAPAPEPAPLVQLLPEPAPTPEPTLEPEDADPFLGATSNPEEVIEGDLDFIEDDDEENATEILRLEARIKELELEPKPEEGDDHETDPGSTPPLPPPPSS